MAAKVESIENSSELAASETTTVPVKTRLSYSAFRFSDVLVMQNMASFVHLFYTITYHIPPVWLAGLQPVMKFLDVAIDPPIGQWSDNTKSKLGRRRPFILWGGIGTAIVFTLLWTPKQFFFWTDEPTLRQVFIYYIVVYIGYYIFHSVCVVPYNALGAELSPNYDERTRIFSWRHLIGLPAVPLATLTYLAATNKSLFASEKDGMPVAAALVGVIFLIGAIITTLGVKENLAVQQRPKMKALEALKITFSNGPFVILALNSFCLAMGQLFCIQFANYLVIYAIYGGDKNAFSKLFTLATIVQVIFAACLNTLIRKITPRVGKQKMLICFAAASLLVPFASLVAFNPAYPYLYFVFACSVTIAVTGMDILPFAIMADVCDLDELKSQRRREGAFAGVYNAVFQAGLLLSPMVTMLALEFSHFNASLPQQTDETIGRFRIVLFAVTGIAFLMALVFAIAFPIRRKDVEAAQAELARRKLSEMA
jgi:GPH family glycoside/pentoside/hexuronide:cation symporter